jgi:hypothetical protein
MFRATICPSSGGLIVFMRHFLLVTLYHPHRVTNTKYRIDIRSSPDDQEHSRPKHIEKRNKHTKKNSAPIWFYLQEYS